MKTIIHSSLSGILLATALVGSVFALSIVESLQTAVDGSEDHGTVQVVSFENGVVTLTGSVKEGIDISTIESALREADGVGKFVLEIIVDK